MSSVCWGWWRLVGDALHDAIAIAARRGCQQRSRRQPTLQAARGAIGPQLDALAAANRGNGGINRSGQLAVRNLARRVDIHAADGVTSRVENGVGEAAPRSEVGGVIREIAFVVGKAHRMRPRFADEAGRRLDVIHARGPRGIVALVVPDVERAQA